MGTRITTAPGGTHHDSAGRLIGCGERVRLADTDDTPGTVARLDTAGVWVTRPDRPRACFCHAGRTLTIVDGSDG